MRLAAVLACLASPMQAQIAPDMTQEDCPLSYEIAASATFVPMTYTVAPSVDAAGWCVIGGLELDADSNFTINVGTVRWRAAEYARLNQNLPPTALMLRVGNLGYVPRVGEPVLDYLFQVQNRRNTYDALLDISWDPEGQEIILHNAHVDFWQDNHITLSGRVGEVDLANMAALQRSAGSAALHDLSIRISTFGLFENLIMMPLGSAFLSGTDDPAARLDGLKAQGTAVIDTIPARIIDGQSAEALQAVLSDIPHPNGTLDVTLQSSHGIGAATFMGLALRGAPPSPAEIWSALTDLTITANYTSEAWE